MDAQQSISKVIWTLVFVFFVFDLTSRVNQPPITVPQAPADSNSSQNIPNQDQSSVAKESIRPEEPFAPTADFDNDDGRQRNRRDSDKLTLSVLRVDYCSTCSYKGAFQQLNEYLNKRYPTLIIEGGDYPLTPQRMFMGKIVTFAQYGLYALMLLGDRIFPALGMAPPSFYYRMKEKKVMSFLAIMFLGNTLQSWATSSGAFEVYLDNQLIFSKLMSGKMPTNEEIDSILLTKGI